MLTAGVDPGTSSVDVLILEDGRARDQIRIQSTELAPDPTAPCRWLQERGPVDLIAGPSGYGLPLIHARDVTGEHLDQMSLVREDDRGQSQGVTGFTAMVRAFCESDLPVVFLPGAIHLPTIPSYRKHNRIDLGTADKVCVAALALSTMKLDSFCLIELGSAFTSCMVLKNGAIVDALGGTSGPMGWRSGGAWDGEVAYLLNPMRKQHLFEGGAESLPEEVRTVAFVESLLRHVAGLAAVTTFDHIVLSGRLLQTH